MPGLHEVKLFAGLLSQELKQLEQTGHLRRCAAGETIFKEGDPGDGLFLVNDGQVEISALVGETQRRVLARIGPGDFFGEMAVLEDRPRSAAAMAATDCVVQFISSAELLAVLGRSPKVAVSMLREISERMRKLDDQFTHELLQAERLSLVGRFTRSILHDIKGPLTVISMAAETGCSGTATPEVRQVCVQRVRKQVDRLTHMINELMEFTRGERSQMILFPLPYREFAQPLIEDLTQEARARRVELVCENPVPSVSLPFDPNRLANVFFNLANNAFDAMPGGGRLHLRHQVTPETLTVEVEDTGPGIAPEIADRLFEPFATFGKARGTGLGLSICRKIIEDHHGTIRAVSQPGHGALFRFTLPLRPA